MHRCQRFFNVLKHSWKAFVGILRSSASEIVLIASIDSKRRPFSVDLSFGNRKKSAGARSGEYGGCGTTVVACLAKKTRNDECAGALSCWSIHRFSRHVSGLFFLTFRTDHVFRRVSAWKQLKSPTYMHSCLFLLQRVSVWRILLSDRNASEWK